MTQIVERLKTLSPEKRAVLMRALQAKQQTCAASTSQSAPLATCEYKPEQAQQLSSAQQRLWFLDQLDPETTTYNIPIALRLTGPLDISAFERSLTEIVRRHGILRATFGNHEGSPVQYIQPPPIVVLPVHTANSRLDIPQEEYVRQWIVEQAQQPFDLMRGPLFRFRLLRLAPTEHIFNFTVHHIVFDGWSTRIFGQELAALYSAYCNGEVSPLPELPLQYTDYAVWQRQQVHDQVFKQQAAYWKQQLAATPPALELPTDYPRTMQRKFRGATQPFMLPPQFTVPLRQLCNEEHTTPFIVLLTAFLIFLARHSEQEDILVGTPIAGRTHSQIEGLIGFFVNTLVLRTQVTRTLSFREVLRHARHTFLEAYDHQDISFDQLVEIVQPERNASQNPLFQVMFSLRNDSEQKMSLHNLQVQWIDFDDATAHFDISLLLIDACNSFEGGIKYNADLFERTTIESFIHHYLLIIKRMLAQPDQCVWTGGLLTPQEQHQLLFEWNSQHIHESITKPAHELFAEQAQRIPHAPAVRFLERTLTYQELDQRSNLVASYLRAHGIRAEQTVGLCMQRSLELIVSIIGILKAGGVYVPLDPGYPEERLSFMLIDAGVTLLLTQQALLEYVPAMYQGLTVCVDSDWTTITCENSIKAADIELENLAYIIYTSGSTGQPKGTLLSHRALANHLQWRQHTYPLMAEDRFLHKASIGFDISLWEILWPLVTGACLVLARPGGQKDSVYLAQTVKEERISVIHFSPAQLHLMLEQGNLYGCHSLRRVFCGGEALTQELQTRFFEQLDADLHQQYGPTEACIDVTIWDCERNAKQRHPPIGSPIENTRIYVLDYYLQPVPIGTVGEIYIGGSALARGYLNKPETTAERFLPDPYSRMAGERIYRTGDLGCYRPDGNLIYMGRTDRQVKIRGYRIELEEISAVLNEHPTVRNSFLMVRQGSMQDKQLVAYLVGSALAPVAELHQFLRTRLPEYMLPTHYVPLIDLPLTANGKVDQRALPAPDLQRSLIAGDVVAPRTAIEMQLVHIWEEILETRPVGVTDNFFHLGGHSLLAVRLIAQLRCAFDVDLPLATLFQASTIEQLAAVLVQRHVKRTPRSTLVGIQTKGKQMPLFLIHPVGGEVLCYQNLAHQLGSDQPVYGLQSIQERTHRPQTIEYMAARYIEAIQEVEANGPYQLGGWSLGGVIAFEMARQLGEQQKKIASLFLIDSYAPASLINMQEAKSDRDLLQHFAHDLMGIADQHFMQSLEQYSNAPSLQPYLRQLLQLAQKQGLLPAETVLPQIESFWQTFTQNFHAARSYLPQRITQKIVLFCAQDDVRNLVRNHTHGWEELTSEYVEIEMIQGDHYGIIKLPSVAAIANTMKKYLSHPEQVYQ